MTQVQNEFDEMCTVCNHPLGVEELEGGVDIHSDCYWRVMDEYDEEMKKHGDRPD
jgi:hypothetical protein